MIKASLVAAAYLYNVAPRDGTYLASVSETLALDTAIAKESDKKLIDARRLPYIGRLTTNIEMGVAKPGSNIKSCVSGPSSRGPT